MQCPCEDLRWDLQAKNIPSEYFSGTWKIVDGVRMLHHTLEFCLLIKNDEFETKYCFKVAGETMMEDDLVWDESTPLDGEGFNVSEYLMKCYETLPTQSALVANLSADYNPIDVKDGWDLAMDKRDRLVGEIWAKEREKQNLKAMARQKTVRNHRPHLLRANNKQNS